MHVELLHRNGRDISLISGDEVLITDPQSALDLAMGVKYETGAARMVLDKALFCEDFFVLSTGLAGEVLQKWINYHIKAALYGDFSRYTSKPLRDFIYESNQGTNFFFLPSCDEAVERLSQVP